MKSAHYRQATAATAQKTHCILFAIELLELFAGLPTSTELIELTLLFVARLQHEGIRLVVEGLNRSALDVNDGTALAV